MMVKVASGGDGQVPAGVPCQRLDHVPEEPILGYGDVVGPRTVDCQGDRGVGLASLTLEGGDAHAVRSGTTRASPPFQVLRHSRHRWSSHSDEGRWPV